MFPIEKTPPTGAIPFDDEVPGPPGVEGWYCEGDRILRIHVIGTDSPEDWKNNFRFKLVPITAGSREKVHEGALLYANRFIRRFEELVRGKDEVVISAHSMGTLLTPIAVLTLSAKSSARFTVVLNGPVPMCNGHFKRRYMEKIPETYRRVNRFDFFTHILGPFLKLFFGYRSIGWKISLPSPTRRPFAVVENHMWWSYT